MNDIRETSIDHVSGEDYATLFTSERKWINYIYKLKESHPDEVDIRHVNDDGSLIVHIPASWMKIKPKKKVVLTDEQIEAIWTMKYLPTLSGQYDNVSSGLCYHSTGGLS